MPAPRQLQLLVTVVFVSCSAPATDATSGSGGANASGGTNASGGAGSNDGGAVPGSGGANASGGVDGGPDCSIGRDFASPGPSTPVTAQVGPGDHFRLDRPAAPPSAPGYPLVVFSVGTGAVPADYDKLLRHFASHGLAVISGDSGNQGEGAQALEALDWMLAASANPSSPYFQLIDGDRIAAAGHSQGGNTSLHVALKDARVKVVLPLEPGKGALGGAQPADDSLLSQPVFYLCGGSDVIVPAAWCADRFAVVKSPAWRATVASANHLAPPTGMPAFLAVATEWLAARLLGDCAAELRFDGPDFPLARDPTLLDVQRKNLTP